MKRDALELLFISRYTQSQLESNVYNTI